MSRKSDIVRNFNYKTGGDFYSKYKIMQGIHDFCGAKPSATAIWKIQEKKSKNQYVVKVLKESSNNGISRTRFLREIEAMSILQNVALPIIESNINQEEPWYIMPKATTLKKHIEKNLSFQKRVKISLELASKLSIIHNNGYFHRDIKPENIFYLKNQFYFGDFELVGGKKYSSDNPTIRGGEKLANKYYIAPELEDPDIKPDAIHYEFCDVFSLAKLIYVILKKENRDISFSPFTGSYQKGHGECIKKQVKNTFELLNELFLDSMNVLWEKRPTAKVFYERLNKWNDIDNNPKEAMRYTLKGKTKDFIRKLPVGEYTFREFSEYRYYLQDLLNQKNMKIKSLNVPEMEIVSVEQSPFNTSIKLNCRYDNNNKYSLIFFPSFLEINCISRLDFTLRVNVYNPGIAEKGYKYLTKKEFKMITVFFENIQETLIVGEESGIEFFSKYSEETDLNQRDG